MLEQFAKDWGGFYIIKSSTVFLEDFWNFQKFQQFSQKQESNIKHLMRIRDQ